MKRGLIGKKLSHSYSVDIHTHLSGKLYELKELSSVELEEFMIAKDFSAINVTVPYKQTVIPYLSEIDGMAKRINAVNTIVNRNGKLYGYNTDIYGFKFTLEHYKVKLDGRKVIVLGNGGAAQAIKAVLEGYPLRELVTVKPHAYEGCVDYDECYLKHTDAEIVINTSPVGMYPNVNACPLVLDSFYQLESVIDIVYNPLKTKLLVAAEKLNVQAISGLLMLVAQAKKAIEIFDDVTITDKEVVDYMDSLVKQKRNIVLIGMPGCGKSLVLRYLNDYNGYVTVDIDEEIVRKTGKSITQLFDEVNEEGFRQLETRCIEEVSKKKHQIIACGGGAVTRSENMDLLRQNGYVVFIDRDPELLPIAKGRPLSKNRKTIMKLYHERIALYEKYSDVTVVNNSGIDEMIAIIEKIIE